MVHHRFGVLTHGLFRKKAQQQRVAGPLICGHAGEIAGNQREARRAAFGQPGVWYGAMTRSEKLQRAAVVSARWFARKCSCYAPTSRSLSSLLAAIPTTPGEIRSKLRLPHRTAIANHAIPLRQTMEEITSLDQPSQLVRCNTRDSIRWTRTAALRASLRFPRPAIHAVRVLQTSALPEFDASLSIAHIRARPHYKQRKHDQFFIRLKTIVPGGIAASGPNADGRGSSGPP
jgi:hypothetical protein